MVSRRNLMKFRFWLTDFWPFVRLLLLSAILDLDLTVVGLICPGFFPLTNFHMQVDAGCQPTTSTPEKIEAVGPLESILWRRIPSLQVNQTWPNRKRHKGSFENCEKPSEGYMDCIAFANNFEASWNVFFMKLYVLARWDDSCTRALNNTSFAILKTLLLLLKNRYASALFTCSFTKEAFGHQRGGLVTETFSQYQIKILYGKIQKSC